MSTSEEFLEYVLDLLRPLESIQTSRMFGGVLLSAQGGSALGGKDRQLGVLIKDTVYFKVTNTTLQKRYKSNGSKQFTYTRKDKKDPIIIKNWWSVPDKAMDNSDELVRLAEEVLAQQE